MILQLGVKPSWFDPFNTSMSESYIPGTPSAGDLRGYMINSPRAGDSAVPEMLLKVLEPYHKHGMLLSCLQLTLNVRYHVSLMISLPFLRLHP